MFRAIRLFGRGSVLLLIRFDEVGNAFIADCHAYFRDIFLGIAEQELGVLQPFVAYPLTGWNLEMGLEVALEGRQASARKSG